MKVLGIESSCDETAAAVVADGRIVLSSVVASQVAIHRPYNGIVPELASRQHLRAVVPVVSRAIAEAGMTAGELDGVAVTQGPGLIGALLVGFSFAKAYAWALGLPRVGVDHLEAHIHAVFLCEDPPPFPFVALMVSGGHTCLYHVTGPTTMTPMGQTRDDAAGEAFDKVAKMLDLGYPGGEVIDRIAADGDPTRVDFPRAFLNRGTFDFSFSGLKSAVRRHLETHPTPSAQAMADIAASFQEAVVDVLAAKAVAACRQKDCRHLALVGGVAANRRLRARLTTDARSEGISVHIPPPALCGDNAAMVAAAGYHRLMAGETISLDADVFSRHPTRIAAVTQP
jgi:N6-L-threonylcarbamoyladenine synthase